MSVMSIVSATFKSTALIFVASSPLFVYAQDAVQFPQRPLRMVVPFPPGGSTDIVGRIVAGKLGEALGQQVVVDNRAGAGGNLGTDMVAKAQADGHTMLMCSVTTLAIGASLYTRLPYSVTRDLAPVALVGSVPFVLLVNSGLPAKSVAELVSLAKARPGKLNFGSAGTGTSAHFASELFKSLAGIDIVHVPYKGNAPAIADLMGGHIQMMFDFLPSAMPHIKSGKVRALAVSPTKRASSMPNVPTVAEAGVGDYDMLSYFGVLVPAKTPASVLARLNSEINRIATLDDTRERYASQGVDPAAQTPEQFRTYLQSEIAKWAKIVTATGVKVD